MKIIKLIAIVAFGLLFSQCKTMAPTAPLGPSPSLLEVQQILDTTGSRFLQFADSTNGDPWRAIMLTANWVRTQPTVQMVSTIDSSYINIFLKSGLEADFSFDAVNDSGYSYSRGGRQSKAHPHLASFSSSTHTITNKKVLIYAPAWTEFNLQSTVPKTVSTLANSGLNLQVTVLKDEECTPAIVNTFKDYGLVILDTHGEPSSFMSGTIIDLTVKYPNASQWRDAIVLQAGQDVYDKLATGDYKATFKWEIPIDIPNWQKRKDLKQISRIWVTTKFIKTLAPMPLTVVFGNMCYSGFSVMDDLDNVTYPMATAFMDKNPISYYGYALRGGISTGVSDDFSKEMEDSLVKRLVNDGDSTGIAHLRPADGAEFFDTHLDKYEFQYNQRHVTLLFKHFGPDDYSYQKCGDTLVDSRDGQKYTTTCIGKQVWMAENLRYNAPGSLFYNDDPSNGPTYGKLYNWNTIMNGSASSSSNPSQVQGICPKGWHVPSAAEWSQMITFLGGAQAASLQMKSTSHWNTPDGSTNSSGFTALPGGYGTLDNGTRKYVGLGDYAYFGTSLEYSQLTTGAYNVSLFFGYANVNAGASKTDDNACRCVKNP